MYPEINLEPLQKLFTAGIPPKDFAEKLDEILINYARMAIELQETGTDNDVFFIRKLPGFYIT